MTSEAGYGTAGRVGIWAWSTIMGGFAIVRINQPDAGTDDRKPGGGQGGVPNLLRGGKSIAVVEPVDEVAEGRVLLVLLAHG